MTRIIAENLAKFQASRAGYRAHLTQTIKKATNITTKESDSLTNSDIASLKSIIEQLTRKRSILQELDDKIVAMIEEPKELEKEVFQSEDIKEEIDETSAQISNIIEQFLFVKSSTNNPPSQVPQVTPENTSIQTPTAILPNTNDQPGLSNEIVLQENSPPINTQQQNDIQPSTSIESQDGHLSSVNMESPIENPASPPPSSSVTPHLPPPTF